MPEPIKLCLFCRHCEFNEGGALSEVTWESGSIECRKGMNEYCSNDREDFARWSRKAETCPSYEPDK